MTHGSLFSGIGGFDLAAEWMGWENKFHCEWNEFGQRVLKHYWPQAELFTDITKSDFTKYANKIDVLTGGFPCQPYSMAGKRLGKEDDRHLWPQMLRAIREIQPTWVVGENVLGIVNWNGGLVFEEVQADLEAEGYEVQPYVLPAAAVNAPHRRDRVWFVAYSSRYANGLRTKGRLDMGGQLLEGREWEKKTNGFNIIGENDATNTDKCSKRSPGKSTSLKRNGSNINDESSQWRESTQFNTGCNEFLRNAADTNCNGFNQCNGNDEINASERGFDAQRDTLPGNGDGDAADSESKSSQRLRFEQREFGESQQEQFGGTDCELGSKWNAANTDQKRLQCKRESTELGRKRFGLNNAQSNIPNWENFPTQSPICSGDDGFPTGLGGITFSKWRNESIKAYGNAVVPQVVYQLFKTIELMNDNSFTNHD